jgi:DNA-binding transcriptional ArsR family regulator
MTNASGSSQATALAALGDPTRRAIFEQLGERPSAVGELAGRLPVSRPAVSQHLRVLKEAGLVVDERQGSRRVYRLHPEGIAELRDYLDRFWGSALASFKAGVERLEIPDPAREARQREEGSHE